MNEQTSILHTIQSDALTGSISTPIYQTSTFEQEAPGQHKGYDYARTNNPTRHVLETLMAKLENGHKGFAFASGLAAIDAVLKLLKAGDEIVAVNDIYGGAYRLFTHVYEKFGIRVTYVDTTNAQLVAEAIRPATRLIWLETPTNPTLKVSDIAAIAQIANNAGVWLCVDNTFASPALQKPLELGAHLVVHSATKYLGGHSDLIAGLVVTKTEELSDKIKFIQNASGAILGPFDAWLVIRGVETLPLRLAQHCHNALALARFLQQQPQVNHVYYPGLPTHKNHHIAQQQMTQFGGIVSFDLIGDNKEEAVQFLKNLKLFKLAESLGGVKSLACLPCEMTHKSVPREKRYASGVTDSLIRLSAGIEHPDDLVKDLASAFKKINATVAQTV